MQVSGSPHSSKLVSVPHLIKHFNSRYTPIPNTWEKDPRTLTDLIMDSNPKTILQLIKERKEEFDGAHIGAIFKALTKSFENSPQLAQQFIKNHKNQLHEFSEFIVRKFSELNFGPQSLSMICRGCNKLNLKFEDLFSKIVEEILNEIDLRNAFNAQSISTILHAFVGMNVYTKELFKAFAEDILKNEDLRNDFDAQSISLTLRAFGESKYKHKELFAAFAHDILTYPSLREKFISQHICMLFRAFAAIDYKHEELFDQFATDILENPSLRHEFTAQGISIILRACGELKYKNRELFDIFAARSLIVIGICTFNEVGRMVISS